jgi:hypothetical protein
MTDETPDLSSLREERAPDVVGPAFSRFRRKLIAGGLVLAVGVGAVSFIIGRAQESDVSLLEETIGSDHGPLHLVAQQLVGGEEWKTYAYLDADGRPCLIETLGGGSCHAHAGNVKGEIADYGTSGSSWQKPDGTRVEYVVVTGTVPSDVEAVLVEFDDGTVERVSAELPPDFTDRVFALLSEGPIDRKVLDVRIAESS